MISTLRLFIELLRRKAAPSDLPASPRLLAATFLALAALQGLFAGAFGEDSVFKQLVHCIPIVPTIQILQHHPQLHTWYT